MKAKRLEFLDIAKGLLILMVIIGHFKVMAIMCFSLNVPEINDFSAINDFWISFFMPAFFVITGYCSSFDRDFKTFLYKSFRTILLPAIIFSTITQFFVYCAGGASLIWNIKTVLKSVFINGAEEYWFCNALFMARLMCWVGNRFRNIYNPLLIFLILGCLGIYLYDSSCVYNYWNFQHSLVCVLFMWIGHLIRKKGNPLFITKGWIFMVSYLVLFFSSFVLDVNIPAIHNKMTVNFLDYPYLLILALTGTLGIIFISSQIEKWGGIGKIIAYMGKNSLILYLSHFLFYRLYIYVFYPMLVKHNVEAIVTTFFVFVITVLSCCALAWIMNYKLLKWIIGK